MADALLKHAFVSPYLDGPDATKLQPSNWNASLLLSGGADGDLLVADALSATGGSWLSPASIDVRTHGLVGDGVTDNTAALQAAINEAALTGARLSFPPGTFRCDGQLLLPNDGAAIPTQQPQMWVGTGCHFSGQTMVPVGGTILDLRYAGADAKIKTHGLGSFELSGITFKDDGVSSNPFLFTTLTTIHPHDVAFIGNPSKANATCDQDAIVLGGTTSAIDGSDDSKFQGYGTVIERCYFARIRRGVFGRWSCNGIVVRDNTWWNTCGATSAEAAIDFSGSPTGSAIAGNHVTGNLIEMVGYVYGIRATYATGCYFANSFFDHAVGTLAYYLFEQNAVRNLVQDVFRDDVVPLLLETGTAVGTNSSITARQSQTSVLTSPWRFENTVTCTGIVRLQSNPFAAVEIQPGVALPNDAVVPFEIKRSAAEAVSPGAAVFSVEQSGKLLLRGGGAGNLDFSNLAGTLVAQFAANGKQWLLAGSGGNMEINSGTGGSYIRFTAFGLKLRDQASANEVVIKSGAGVPTLAAPVGSLFLRTNGGAGSTLYVKESGTDGTGWVAK